MNLNNALSILAAFAPVLIPAGLFVYHLGMAQLPASKRANVERELSLIVSAVEQTYKAVPGSGAFKKAEVIRLAGEFGLKVDPKLLDVLIESSVATLAKPGSGATN